MEKPATYKFCIVPICKNTVKNAPGKVFFLVPRGAEIRRKWCDILQRRIISPTTALYCCEDHFDIEEDTENYMEYKLMNKQKKLRLKKDILPHKFIYQKEDTESLKRNVLFTTEGSGPPAKQSALAVSASLSDYLEAGTSSFYENTANKVNEAASMPSMLHKAIQVSCKLNYRSKGVNVNLCSKTTASSPLKISKATSPIKITPEPDFKCNSIFVVDTASTSSAPLSQSSLSSYEPSSTTYDSSWIVEDDPQKETFKNEFRNCFLTALEKEPKMMLGLPNSSFHLIKLFSEHLSLPTIDILITLKKIKLNESFKMLAVQFGLSQPTVSRIFSKTLPIMADKLKDLIVWPTPDEIFNNLPISFRTRYSTVISIIDCLEIEIEQPSDPVHQSMTWSQYKKCNTLKYLISCTPNGLINFISEGYGGRATDVTIVEDSGFLNHLHPKKAIMADRGFKDLSYLVEKKECTLIRPPSVYQGSPSSKEEVYESKRIAALRIHVERVINRLREFHMLLPHARVDHNLISVIDEVIVVACAVCNMQSVLIKH